MTSQPINPRVQLLRMEDVAEQTGVPIETLRWWRKRNKGEGPRSAKLGRRVVYRQSDVDAWIEAAFADTDQHDSPGLRAV